MKTFKKTILVLMAVAAVSLTSCKKDDDGGGGGGAVAGKITAKVDGASFESSEMVTTATRVNANGLVVINLFGSNLQPESKTITMTISGVDGTGTYPIDGNAGNVFTNASYTEANAS